MSDDVTELPDGLDESEREAWQVWVANGMNENVEEFHDCYAGEWVSLADYAENLCSECYDIPDWCEYYIDYEAMGRDWDLGGDIWVEESDSHSLYVFRNY